MSIPLIRDEDGAILGIDWASTVRDLTNPTAAYDGSYKDAGVVADAIEKVDAR